MCPKNDTDFAHYNFNIHQPILVNFGINVTERVCYRTVICFSIPHLTNVSWGNMETRKSRLSNAVLVACQSSASHNLIFFNC